MVSPLIEGIAFDGLIADKAFDSNALVAALNDRSAKVVISQHPGQGQKLWIDAAIYAWHIIENFFASSRISSASPCVPARQIEALRP